MYRVLWSLQHASAAIEGDLAVHAVRPSMYTSSLLLSASQINLCRHVIDVGHYNSCKCFTSVMNTRFLCCVLAVCTPVSFQN